MFNNKNEGLFSLPEEPSFGNTMKFSVPDETVFKELRSKLVVLSSQNLVFKIEKRLKKKQLTTYTKIDDIVDRIVKDLEDNYMDYAKEFEDEPMGFVYYLGNQIFFSDTVEIVQKIYHEERTDIGNLYCALVVKFKEGIYYYWEW